MKWIFVFPIHQGRAFWIPALQAEQEAHLWNCEDFTVTNLPTMEFSEISERLYLIEKIGRGERI